MRRDLSEGGWVEFRDPSTVTAGQRELVEDAMEEMGALGIDTATDTVPPGAMKALRTMRRATALCLVESWSFDSDVSSEGLRDLPTKAYDEILGACDELLPALLPDFSPTPDPDSPTEPSDA